MHFIHIAGPFSCLNPQRYGAAFRHTAVRENWENLEGVGGRANPERRKEVARDSYCKRDSNPTNPTTTNPE